MTCPRLRHEPSEFDEGPPAHSEAGSSLTCAKHTFMWSTCQAGQNPKIDTTGESRSRKARDPSTSSGQTLGHSRFFLCQLIQRLSWPLCVHSSAPYAEHTHASSQDKKERGRRVTALAQDQW